MVLSTEPLIVFVIEDLAVILCVTDTVFVIPVGKVEGLVEPVLIADRVTIVVVVGVRLAEKDNDGLAVGVLDLSGLAVTVIVIIVLNDGLVDDDIVVEVVLVLDIRDDCEDVVETVDVLELLEEPVIVGVALALLLNNVLYDIVTLFEDELVVVDVKLLEGLNVPIEEELIV